MYIEDSAKMGGVFHIHHLRGVKKHGGPKWSPQGFLWQRRKEAILAEGGIEALHHEYTRMGGEVIDYQQAHNRLVDNGLTMINGLLKGSSALVPNRMKLGSGGTPGSPGSYLRTLNDVVSAGILGANGLGESVFDSFTNTASGLGGNDTLTFIRAYTASGALAGANAPDEVIIRCATGPTAFCYAPFASARDLANTDVLTVTYVFKLVP